MLAVGSGYGRDCHLHQYRVAVQVWGPTACQQGVKRLSVVRRAPLHEMEALSTSFSTYLVPSISYTITRELTCSAHACVACIVPLTVTRSQQLSQSVAFCGVFTRCWMSYGYDVCMINTTRPHRNAEDRPSALVARICTLRHTALRWPNRTPRSTSVHRIRHATGDRLRWNQALPLPRVAGWS
jgi:hypothetical protein